MTRICFLTIIFFCTMDLNCKKAEDIMEISDADGNIYSTITIGSQVWMAENLKTTKYKDGTTILPISDNNQWSSSAEDAYCWYDNDISNKDYYGALYNWYAVNSGKLCPAGWHVPSDTDWTVLTDFLGGLNVAGGKLKEAGTIHWKNPNSDATDEYGFAGLPGGFRNIDGIYSEKNEYGNWWSSTIYEGSRSWLRWFYFDNGICGRVYYSELGGLSVRCLRD